MIVFGRCRQKASGFTEGKIYDFTKYNSSPILPEDEYIEDDDEIEFYVCNDKGRIMAVSSDFFDDYFEMVNVEA